MLRRPGGIAGYPDPRSSTLEQGLRNLLDDDGKKDHGGVPTGIAAAPDTESSSDDLTEKVLGHGLIRTLYRSSRWYLQLLSSAHAARRAGALAASSAA